MTAGRKYTIRIFFVSIAYMLLLFLAMAGIAAYKDNDLLRAIFALLPSIPIGLGVLSFMAFLRKMDELQQKIQMEAFGFSIAVTGVISFTLGMLERAGFPNLNLIWVFPMLILFWGFGTILAKRRYE